MEEKGEREMCRMLYSPLVERFPQALFILPHDRFPHRPLMLLHPCPAVRLPQAPVIESHEIYNLVKFSLHLFNPMATIELGYLVCPE